MGRRKNMGSAPRAPWRRQGSPQEFAVNVGDLVHFQEDSSALTGEAKSILMNQVRWLNRYTQYNVTIEGHADERGTREYNLALGARRAMAVKGFLRGQRCGCGAHPHHLLRQGAADRGLR